jgi:hypothetical protein
VKKKKLEDAMLWRWLSEGVVGCALKSHNMPTTTTTTTVAKE